MKHHSPIFSLANEGDACLGLENEVAIGADGWLRIAPYGDHIKERIVSVPGGSTRQERFLQRLDRSAAEAMVKRFSSLIGRIKRFVVGVPIFKSHPDLATHAPETVQPHGPADKTEFGLFADLEARDDGFYGRPVMGAAGKAAIENEGLKYLSPFWWVVPTGESRNGIPIVSPIELISAGLTRTPNISGGDALANDKSKVQETNQPPHTMDRTTLLLTLAAAGIALANDATDDQISTGIATFIASLQSRVTALENEKNTLTSAKTESDTALTAERTAHATTRTALDNERTARITERKARIDAALDTAIAQGRITAAERPQWATSLANEAEFAAKLTELAARKGAIKTFPVSAAVGARRAAIANEMDRMASVQEAVSKKMAAGMTYDAAFAAVTKEMAATFAAMHTPQKPTASA